MFKGYDLEDTRCDDKTGLPVSIGRVYALINPAWPGYVKFGQTNGLPGRLADYQTAAPHRDYKMIAYSSLFQNVGEVERALHYRLAHCRAAGEWFKISQAGAIEAMRTLESNEPAPKKSKSGKSIEEAFESYGAQAAAVDDPFANAGSVDPLDE